MLLLLRKAQTPAPVEPVGPHIGARQNLYVAPVAVPSREPLDAAGDIRPVAAGKVNMVKTAGNTRRRTDQPSSDAVTTSPQRRPPNTISRQVRARQPAGNQIACANQARLASAPITAPLVNVVMRAP